jgi:hypothetical protein
MMAQRERLYLEKQQRDGLEAVVEHGGADNESEAARRLINAGMAELGYGDGAPAESPLKQLSAEFGRAFAWVGVAWLAITLVAPVELRLGAVFAFAAALGCSVLYVVFDKHEPGISAALKRLFGGGESA